MADRRRFATGPGGGWRAGCWRHASPHHAFVPARRFSLLGARRVHCGRQRGARARGLGAWRRPLRCHPVRRLLRGRWPAARLRRRLRRCARRPGCLPRHLVRRPEWHIDENPPFEELGLELSPPGPIPGSVIQAEDGTWVMYLWGVPAPQSEGAVIYRATASSPAGPWVADPEPVLVWVSPGHGTTWRSTSRRWSRWVRAT